MKNGVVIVTYNRRELLEECLACVMAQTLPFSEVIVVDNCSTDGTREYLDEYQRLCGKADASGGPQAIRMTVLHEEQNLGGAGGFYEGMQAADQMNLDWVLVIDDDAMIAPDYMERLLAFADGRAALAGAVYTEGKPDVSHRRRIANRFLFAEAFVTEQEYAEALAGGGTFSCDAATFCGLLIKGEKIQKIGLPKKEYFLWYDDTEYCLRLADCGGITVVPGARLDHKTKLSKGGMVVKGVLHRITWRQYYGYRNRYDAAYTHLGRLSAMCILFQYRLFRLLSRLMLLRKEDAEQGRYNIRLLTDVIRDCKAHRLGYNDAYHY